MIGVIDTSGLMRLFIPDGPIPGGLEDFFREVERGNNTAIAPELLMVESANVLDKKRKLNEISEEESVQLLNDVLSMPIRYFSHGPLIPSAFDISLEYRMTVYDSMFLALALEQGGGLFTADAKMKAVAEKMHLLPKENGF
jgi:predicted nucleic acid-binding protein